MAGDALILGKEEISQLMKPQANHQAAHQAASHQSWTGASRIAAEVHGDSSNDGGSCNENFDLVVKDNLAGTDMN